MIGFLVRLVVYAAVLGVTARVAQMLWTSHGLDTVDSVIPLHDSGLAALLVAPVILAFFGGLLRRIGVLLAGALIGAALTAPFILARLVFAA